MMLLLEVLKTIQLKHSYSEFVLGDFQYHELGLHWNI